MSTTQEQKATHSGGQNGIGAVTDALGGLMLCELEELVPGQSQATGKLQRSETNIHNTTLKSIQATTARSVTRLVSFAYSSIVFVPFAPPTSDLKTRRKLTKFANPARLGVRFSKTVPSNQPDNSTANCF